MPDDRLIHRTLGHSEKVNKLTDFERGVWLMYKLASDDYGIMRFSAVTLQDAADWLEHKTAKSVQRALEAVKAVGLIDTFGHQGRIYCYQDDWQTWQKITHPRQTSQPLPPADRIAKCCLNTQYLYSFHPKGAKLTSWMHPELRREKKEKAHGEHPESTGNIPSALPEKSPPVFVGSDRVGVGVRGRESAARQTSGVMGGTLPRDHLDHLACFPVCMSRRIAAKYLPRFGNDESALSQWARSVCAEWQARTDRGERVPEGDDYAFWAARYTEHHARASTPEAGKRTQALARATADFLGDES